MRSDNLRVRYFLHCLFHRSGYEHGEFLKKHNAFHSIGESFFFQPYNLPADAKYIRFGNNVVVASNVSFICHDVIHNMLNNSDNYTNCNNFRGGYTTCWGTVDIKDNVFIGSNTTILPNVTVGSNVVIAAGSLVNKDVPDGKIVGGVPAKVIGDVADLAAERQKYSESPVGNMKRDERLKYLWGEE